MSLARQLVERWRQVPYAAIPEGVRNAALLHLLDAIGVGLAAAATSAGRPYLRAAPALNGSGGPATIFGLADGSAPVAAALANGGMIHALEYDDTHAGSIVHGSSVLAATALAAAEGAGASGEALLAAYIKGWEVLIRMGLTAPAGFQAQGFQITSVGGTLAAALVAADLMRLDTATTVDAIGIALSEASGVLEFLTNGSTVKSLHAGWAAHAGIVAATLAGGGLTGPATAFEGQFGLFRRFAADNAAADRFAAAVVSLGETWHLPQAAFKFYPCCHYIHPFIEALETALAQVPGVAVDAVDCEVPPGEALLISEPWERKLAPQTGHEARYSLPIALAARLIGGAVTPASFAEAPSEAVLAKARCVTARPMADAQFPDRFEARLHVRFANGHSADVYVEDVFGGGRRPPPREAVLSKFRTNAAAIGRSEEVRTLEAAILTIEQLPVPEIGRLLRKFQSANAAHSAAA
jgi:2-methylcitrate dehydratase PrpD